MSSHRKYIPSLEGIRGYAFLLVFAVHFTGTSWALTRHTPLGAVWMMLCQLSFVAVPIFFALSGYLITGILLNTRHKPGFFRVFYARRALRVLPLYYAILLIAAIVALASGVPLKPQHALFLVYLHNLWPGVSIYQLGPLLFIGHLWSLAVEEQFYLLWPLVIWFLPRRRNLLIFCYSAAAVMFLSRFAGVALHLSIESMYQNTLLRSDAIMLGAALAVHRRSPEFRLHPLLQPAWVVLAGGTILMITRALVAGQALPYDDFGVRFIMPLLGLMGAAVLVLALHPTTVVSRLCEARWAVHLGKRSYSLYILHQLFAPAFRDILQPSLARHVGNTSSHVLTGALAFAIVYSAGELSFRYVEMPTMRLKRFVEYGEARGAGWPKGLQAWARGSIQAWARDSGRGSVQGSVQGWAARLRLPWLRVPPVGLPEPSRLRHDAA